MIDSFFGNNRFLSNFWPAIVHYKGDEFCTVEHAYQAAKSTDPIVRRNIANLSIHQAGRAKQMGRSHLNRFDWEAVKLDVMEELLREKFSERFLREALLASHDRELIEGNTWNDRYWGMTKSLETGELVGENHLGKLLMKIRKDLSDLTSLLE